MRLLSHKSEWIFEAVNRMNPGFCLVAVAENRDSEPGYLAPSALPGHYRGWLPRLIRGQKLGGAVSPAVAPLGRCRAPLGYP